MAVKSKRRVVRKLGVKKTSKGMVRKAVTQFKHIVLFKVKAGPYPTKQVAEKFRIKASQIKGSSQTPIAKVGNGYGFTIVLRYGAKTAQDKAKIMASLKSHHKNSGVPGSKVSITSTPA